MLYFGFQTNPLWDEKNDCFCDFILKICLFNQYWAWHLIYFPLPNKLCEGRELGKLFIVPRLALVPKRYSVFTYWMSTRISQLWQSIGVFPDNSLSWTVILCIGRCCVASLIFTTWMPTALLLTTTAAGTIKTLPKIPPEGRKDPNHLLLRMRSTARWPWHVKESLHKFEPLI